MSARSIQTLEINQGEVFAHDSGQSLALVDVETYPAFVSRQVDRFDLMAHLSDQMQALTALSWRAPDEALRFRLLLTENDELVSRISHTNPAQIASGNLRSYGQVCLTTHDHLFDCAKHCTHDLLHKSVRAKVSTPRLLNVPAGVYAVSIYYQTPFLERNGEPGESKSGAKIDYTVILRHYAFPPPRPAPVRLSAGFIPWVGEEAASHAWGVPTSHKAPGVGVPRMAS